MPIVTSSANERLRWVRRLAGDRRARRREGLWVAEGVRLAEEVLREGLPVRLWVLERGWGAGEGRQARIREAAERQRGELLEVPRGLLREISDTETPQGVLVVFEAPQRDAKGALAGEGPAVLLDRIQDPGNLGTIARTAEGAGACGLFLAPGCADPGSPKALRASAGALLRLPSVRDPDPLALLRQAGRPLYATAGQGGMAYDRAPLAEAFALLLGQEGGGLNPRWWDQADLLLTVPMAGRLESLNVAATAAAILFEAARQRRCTAAPLPEVRGGPGAP